jgi:hypothetical protein
MIMTISLMAVYIGSRSKKLRVAFFLRSRERYPHGFSDTDFWRRIWPGKRGDWTRMNEYIE